MIRNTFDKEPQLQTPCVVPPDMAAAARAYLARCDALDLAPVLGLDGGEA